MTTKQFIKILDAIIEKHGRFVTDSPKRYIGGETMVVTGKDHTENFILHIVKVEEVE